MNCREVEEQGVIERYFLGQLTDTQRDEFEQHYFECDACSSQVQTGYAIQEGLRHQPLPSSPNPGWIRQKWLWMPAFALLGSLALAIGTWRYVGRPQQTPRQGSSPIPITKSKPQPNGGPKTSGPNLEELARVQPPAYSATLLRGAEDEAEVEFGNAMQHYLKGDFTDAIPGLRAATNASPRAARYSFYLGACYLITGQTGAAIASLQRTISLNETHYSQQAHYYLAIAYLQKKDVSRAKEELQLTVKPGGSMAAKAEEILRQLNR
jgi:tetratricopeptide (TPR) repeat protein